jgi:hypothetical protein
MVRCILKTIVIFLVFFIFTLSTGAEGAKKKKRKKSKYKVINLTNGGNISGKAVFKGKTVPEDETLILTTEQELCGNKLPARKYLINDRREIKNVVVYLADIKSGKKIPSEPVIVDNVLCAFEPHVSIGFLGNDTLNRNSDPAIHTIHAYVRGRTVYNIAVPEKGMQIRKKLKRSGIMTVKCNPHPWMISYVYVFAHPYAAVTDENGEFFINDIPAGSYKVKAWHEGLGEISLGKVNVEAGTAGVVNAHFK